MEVLLNRYNHRLIFKPKFSRQGILSTSTMHHHRRHLNTLMQLYNTINIHSSIISYTKQSLMEFLQTPINNIYQLSQFNKVEDHQTMYKLSIREVPTLIGNLLMDTKADRTQLQL